MKSVLHWLLFGLLALPGAAAAQLTVTNNLELWLRADAGVTTNAAGGVSAWTDQSGAGHSATQATGTAEPVLVNGGWAGEPVVRFSGASQFMNLTGKVLTNAQFTIFAAVNSSSTATGNREFFSNWASTNGFNSIYFGTTNYNPTKARLTDRFFITGAGPITNPATHVVLTGVSSATNVVLYQGRTQIAVTNNPLPVGMILTSPYAIGRQGSDNGEYWVGDVAEIVIYNGTLTATDQATVWSYLETKYGRPTILIPPTNQLVYATYNATFSVNATSTVPFTYQWQYQGTNLAGATNATLTVTNAGTNVAGTYGVVVANSFGSVTSSAPAVLTVNPTYGVLTLAGLAGNSGSVMGSGSNARIGRPADTALDAAGNLYVPDSANDTILKVTPTGTVSLLAGTPGVVGSKDGTNGGALFDTPDRVAVDGAGNLYVADTANATIRKITPSGTNWVVTTLAGLAGSLGTNDGTGSAARFNTPEGVAVDTNGNIYVGDYHNEAIRKITPAGVVTTLAGLGGTSGSADGTGSTARFLSPDGVVLDSAGNLYVADSGNATIRKVTPAGVVTTIAGLAGQLGSTDGVGSAARFNNPDNVAMDSSSNLFVTEYGNQAIRRITPAGVVNTVAALASTSGSADGVGASARLDLANGIAVDVSGNLYIADSANHTIREGVPYYGQPLIFSEPQTVSETTSYGVILTMNTAGYNPLAYQWLFNGTPLAGGTNATLALSGLRTSASGNYTLILSNGFGSVTSSLPVVLVVSPPLDVFTLAGWPGMPGSSDGVGTNAQFNYPTGLALDASNNVYVADSGNDTIRRITPAGEVTTIAGQAGIAGTNDGVGTQALFTGPNNLAIDSTGNIYVADTGNGTIREIVPGGGGYTVTTLAGTAGASGTNDGIGAAARFNLPKDVVAATNGDLYVADEGNNTIRRITLSGTDWIVSTLAGLGGVTGSANGTGSAARFYSPRGLAVDNATNVYVADWDNNTVRKITMGGTVTTLAGLAGNFGTADGTGSAARFHSPHGLTVDAAGNVYVTDFYNCTLRKITPAGVVTTVLGSPGNAGTTDGEGTAAQLNESFKVIGDAAGATFYVADSGNHTIRKAVYDNGQPLINVEPVATPGLLAGSFTLATTVTGAGPLGYQWTFDGNPLAAATNAILTVSNVQFAEGGDYGLQAANGFGSATNPVATVTVVPLIITSQPQSVAVAPGGSTNFSVGVAGLGPVSYQWLANAAAVAGGTNSVLALMNVQVSGAGYYLVLAANSFGSVTSSVATLGLLGIPVSLGTGAGGIQVANGQANFQIGNLTGQGAVVIEASTNLIEWQPIFTNPPGFGAAGFTDVGASNYPNRYYRAVTP